MASFGFHNNEEENCNCCTEFHELWRDLEEAIGQILTNPKITMSRYFELYGYVFKYCSLHACDRSRRPTTINIVPLSRVTYIGQKLYDKLNEFLKNYLRILVPDETEISGENVLEFYTSSWKSYRFCARILNGVCGYLNRNWVPQERGVGREDVYEIYQLAVLIWRDNLFQRLDKHIIGAVLKLIEKQRNGDEIKKTDMDLLSNVIKSYVELGLDKKEPLAEGENLSMYIDSFENVFLEETERFYTRQGAVFLHQNTLSEYIKKVQEILLNEGKLAKAVKLHETTGNKLLTICGRALIENHRAMFVAEFKRLIDAEKAEDLRRLYLLIGNAPNVLSEVQELLETRIVSRGLKAIESCCEIASKDPKVYVNTIAHIHKKYTPCETSSFNSNDSFLATVNKAFETLVNKNSITSRANSSTLSTELAVKFCDSVLTKSTTTSIEVEDELNQAATVFQYLYDKNAFQKLYSKMLVKRLLQNASISDDAEASMISKLGQVCGSEYTCRLHRTLQDSVTSKDLNSAFQTYLKNTNQFVPIDFSIQIFSSGSWLSNQQAVNMSVSIPKELEHTAHLFTKFYRNHQSGRKLTWLYDMSRGELIANGFETRHLLEASTFQMTVLLQFNKSDSWTVQQLSESTQINLEFLILVLQTLLRAEMLSCKEDGDDISANSVMKLFTGYKNERLRIKIDTSFNGDESKLLGHQHTTQKLNERDRQLLIEAAIVRIMKKEKTMEHHQLITEVLQQLSSQFKPSVKTIKERVEKLIEKNYIVRSARQKNIYSYLA